MSRESAAIDVDLVLAALGRGTQDEALRERYAQAGLHNWPDPQDDREDASIEAYWRYGFTLEFDETATQEPLLGVSGIEGPLTVSAALFYADGVAGHTGWQPALPFGLAFDMTPAEVAAVLGEPRASRAPYELRVDQFLRGQYVLDVCYAPAGEGGIDFVSVRPQNIYETGRAVVTDMPWQPLAESIGVPADDAALLARLASYVDASLVAADLADDENTRFQRQSGLTFHGLAAKALGGSGRKICLAGFKMARAGLHGSKGYTGQLPFGLLFGDGPETIGAKLPPDAQQSSHEAHGRYICEANGLFFDVHYSLIHWQIIAVSVFHPALAD